MCLLASIKCTIQDWEYGLPLEKKKKRKGARAASQLRKVMRVRMPVPPVLPPHHLRDCRHRRRRRGHIDRNLLLDHHDLHDLVPEGCVHRTDDRLPWQKRVGCRGCCWGR